MLLKLKYALAHPKSLTSLKSMGANGETESLDQYVHYLRSFRQRTFFAFRAHPLKIETSAAMDSEFQRVESRDQFGSLL